ACRAGRAGAGELLAHAKALLRVRHAENALRASERRFRAITEKSFDAVVLIGEAAAVTYASPSSARVLGYAPEELVGRDSPGLLHPEDRPRAEALFARRLRAPGALAAATCPARARGGP